MEEDARSEDSSQVVVKSRNASGCLIVRKRADGMARPRAGASGLPNHFFESNKDKKRHMMMGHNGVPTSAEPYHRKEVFRTSQVFENGCAEQGNYGAVRGTFDHIGSNEGASYRKRHHSDFLQSDGLGEDFKMERGYNRGGSMYAEVSGKNFMGGNVAAQWAAKVATNGVNEEGLDIRYSRIHYESLNYKAGYDDRGLNYHGDRNRYNIKCNGPLLPGASATANFAPRPSEEYIRVQGKNGVLKVKINRFKGTGFLKTYGHHKPGDFRIGFGNEDMMRRNELIRSSSNAEDIHIPQEQAVLFGRADKHILKTHILIPIKRSRACRSPSDESGTSLKLELKRVEDQNYSGIAIRDGKNNPAAEMSLPTGGKEGKRKRGSGKDEHNLQLLPTKSSNGCDSQSNDGIMPLKLGSSRVENHIFAEMGKSEENITTPPEKCLPTGCKEGKRKRGSRKEKHKLQLLPTKSSNGCDSQSDDGGVSLKLGSSRAENHTFAEMGKSDENRIAPPEKCLPTGSKEGKQKRGSGTEKQKLREHIRKMLLDAGWTIDYRPRRNRDYQDAVYVSPSGTAYWSIVKAYEGLQKQFAEDNHKPEPVGDGSPFLLVADDILSKLTRQTRKKMEKEMKKCRNGQGCGNLRDSVSKKSEAKHVAENAASDEGENQMCSLIKEDRKSLDDMENENLNTESLRTSKNHSRRTLLVRTVNKRLISDDDMYVPYTGKRTLISWLINCGSVKLNEKVQYMNRKQTRALKQGWISKDGIHCLCCSKIVTISKFGLHAGRKVHQPLQSIFLESGVSLLQCMIDAWNKQTKLEQDNFHQVDVKGGDRNDDICGICGDGGDLICCDGCPSTFHLNCLGVEILPPGEWHCPNCLCRHCGFADDNNTQGSDGTCSSLPTCSLCEKKYHQSCIKDVEIDSYSSSFCGMRCRELFETLRKFVGVKHDLGSGFSWSIIHRTDIESDASLEDLALRVECNSKLAVSLEIMDECFLPIVDQRSGINIIHHVVYSYGSNFNRLNFSNFYTAILERGDEVISAACLRFHGAEFAEMPFIGTCHIHRRQGMCRRLFGAIETALRLFKVEKLVIPAISELMRTWTEVFSFNHFSESDKMKFGSMNILVFPGVDMLQKPLLEQSNLNKVAACTAAVKSSSTHEGLPKMLTKSEEAWSAGTDQDGDDSGLRSINETENQGDTSFSESDSDHLHAKDTCHPISTLDLDFDFPPRISIGVSKKDDKDISKSEDSGDPQEGTRVLNNQDALEAADASDNEDKATSTSYASGSLTSEP